MRHIKFASLREVERPFVQRNIQAAMEQAAPTGTRGSGQSVVKNSLATAKTLRRERGRVPDVHICRPRAGYFVVFLAIHGTINPECARVGVARIAPVAM
jgi:hypothetical protein